MGSEVSHALADMALRKQRSRANLDEEGVQSRLDSCRFDDERLGAMALAFDCGDFSSVCELRDGASGPLVAPSAAEQSSLVEFVVDEPLQHMCRDWCKSICRHRDNFANCVIITEHDDEYEYYFFNFAVLRPMVASFSLVRAIMPPEPAILAMATFGERCRIADSLFAYNFELDWGDFILGHEIRAEATARIWVLPHVVFGSANRLQSHSNFMGIAAFLSEFSRPTLEKGLNRKQGRRGEIDGSLLERHPWLQKCQDDRTKKSEGSDSESDASAPEFEEDGVVVAFTALEAKRCDVDVAMPEDSGNDFRVTIRGGAWTARGAPFDSVRGAAYGSEPLKFCQKYRLPKSGTFAYRLYGDRVAECLARFWCARLQALYFAYSVARDDEHRFSDDDLASAPASSEELDAAFAGLPDGHPGWARRAAIAALTPSDLRAGGATSDRLAASTTPGHTSHSRCCSGVFWWWWW